MIVTESTSRETEENSVAIIDFHIVHCLGGGGRLKDIYRSEAVDLALFR